MIKVHLKTAVTDGILCRFSRLGLHPNTWSLLSLPAAAGGLIALWAHSLPWGLACFVLSGVLDMVDGAVARATGKSSTLGAFADGVLDRYVELFLVLGLMLYLQEGQFLFLSLQVWMVLLIFGSLMTSFVRAYADHRGLVKDPGMLTRMGGLLERPERLMLLYAGMVLGMWSSQWLLWTVALVAVLANATALQRIVFAVRNGGR
ncbi:MAG: CDP-alcohol phosphatidyltransferase family protein [Methanosarcinales archaeon]|nr:CDP-alcohol phosphatidyltransferase family protein [Methanosarcinales archaeon]